MPSDPIAASDERVLALFEGAGPVETPTPGVKAWLANDSAAGGQARPVLIKRVAAGQGKARATQALGLLHLNIVLTRRWLIDGGQLYVVRDVVRGRNLRQSLAPSGASSSGARPGPELIRRLLTPVADALEYAHGHGIAHGGIAPENVLISDNGAILVSDWATADPKARQHAAAYGGAASVAGDVRALGILLATYLPASGPFASLAVRGRIEGVIRRCDTLDDLRETLNSLEKLASAPIARIVEKPAAPIIEEQRPAAWAQLPGPATTADPPALKAAPELSTRITERSPHIVQGGGGSATLVVRNEGDAPLIIRMVATQHAWLNVRPMELPLTIPQGGSSRIEFFISAARLTPAEYRSEVYLSANAGGPSAEDLRAGWFKHTSEVRITVEEAGALAGPGVLSYPPDAPKLPAVPGCAGAAGILIAALASLLAIIVVMGASGARLP